MSTLRIDNIGPSAGGTTRSAVRGIAAAWANLNGTGTIALRDSQGVSSVVDEGTGNYTFNWANATADINYLAVCSTSGNGSSNSMIAQPFTGGTSQIAPTTTAMRVSTVQAVTAMTDSPHVQAAIHGDLA